MLNHITIMGRLTRDPELRRTNSGKPVASFTVAVDRDYAPDGQEKETDFIDCVAWNGTGEFVSKYFSKGSMIVVAGRLQIRSWTDNDGNKRRTAEVVANNAYFGESKRSQEGSNANYGQTQAPQNNYGNYPQQGRQQNQNGYQSGYGQPQQGYNPNSYDRQVNAPQHNQQGYGGYQQQGFGGYHAPQQNDYPQLDGDDPKLPF